MSLKAKLLFEIGSSPRRPKYLKKKYGNNKKLDVKLKELLAQGKIYKKDGTYHIASSKKKNVPVVENAKPIENGIVCTVSKLARTFGFVSPVDDEKDIFVPGRFLKGAMPGDKLLVRLFANPQREGTREGEVIKILETNNNLIGVVCKLNDELYLQPDCCPTIFFTIDRGLTGGAKVGEKVAAKIVKRSLNHDHIVSVKLRFGDSACAEKCTKAILYANGIKKRFPTDVKEECEKYINYKIPQAEIEKRLDLRNRTIFTIDAASTKDIDDAISAKKTDYGYKIGVHIADVSHYVTPDTLLNKEAFNRGTSIYYAQNVIPMLPTELSNGICSLNEKEDRLAFSCIIKLDENCNVIDYAFKKTVICSKLKGVYSEINSIFDNTATDNINNKYSGVITTLLLMKEIYEKLQIKRNARGSMAFESNEAKILVDENGVCIGLEKRKSGVSEKLIEEFMLLANGCSANLAKKMKIPFVYRVHEEPDAEKIVNLKEKLNSIGIYTNFKEKVPNQLEISKLLDDTKGTKLESIVHMNILRSMSKARYESTPIGHYGLVLEDYAHFTSPIRRYPDLAIHRILSDLITGNYSNEKLVSKYTDFANSASDNSSLKEFEAVKLERDCNDCYKAEYISKYIGEIFIGKISGITLRGLFVELDNTIEGFISYDSISRTGIDVEEDMSFTIHHSNTKFGIGDDVNIEVIAADVSKGRVDFRLVVANL